MSRIWKKIRGRWQLYWQDDGDDPGMIHLSRRISVPSYMEDL